MAFPLLCLFALYFLPLNIVCIVYNAVLMKNLAFHS